MTSPRRDRAVAPRALLAVLITLLGLVLALVVACGGPAPVPSSCWRAFQGVYHLDGTPDAAAAEAETIAAIMNARLATLGLATFLVTTNGSSVVVDLPTMDEADEGRALLTATGNIQFVPVSQDVTVQPGDPAPVGVPPLVDRDGIQSMSAGASPQGQPTLDIKLTRPASQVLTTYTEANVGGQLALVVDGVVETAPTINEPLAGDFQVSGLDPVLTKRMLIWAQTPMMPGPIAEERFGEVGPPEGCQPAAS